MLSSDRGGLVLSMNERELRLLRVLLGSLHAIQQDLHSLYEQLRVDSHQQPPARFKFQSEIRLPPAVGEYFGDEQRARPSNTLRDRIRLWFEGIALFAAILAAIFTYSTLIQIKRQADSAQNQVTLMAKQLEADQRAWIHVKYSVFGKIEDKAVFTTTWPLTVVNLGRNPALHIKAEAFVEILDRKTPPTFNFKKPHDTIDISTLFPGTIARFSLISGEIYTSRRVF